MLASTNIPDLVIKLKRSDVKIDESSPNYIAVFIAGDKAYKDDIMNITRAVQEEQIHRTKIYKEINQNGKIIDKTQLSFWDVWFDNENFQEAIIDNPDPNEAKWLLQRAYNYGLATTFQPEYARAIYKYYNAKSILDPCGGWGDRLIGAASLPMCEKYVCFDPNTHVRPGYVDLMKYFGHSMIEYTDKKTRFSNGFEAHNERFEIGACNLASNTFDLVFTSPPFFKYEIYSPNNPTYINWIDEFYHPLMIESCRCVKVGGHVLIHIDDTSAGKIVDFMTKGVSKICNLRLIGKLGLYGFWSKKTRPVWVFVKV